MDLKYKSYVGYWNSLLSLILLFIFPPVILIKDLVLYSSNRKYSRINISAFSILFFYMLVIQLTRIPESDFYSHVIYYTSSNFKGFSIEFIWEGINWILASVNFQFKTLFVIIWLSTIYFFWWSSLNKLNLLNIEVVLLTLFIPYFFMSLLQLTQQSVSISVFFYGLVMILVSKTKKDNMIGMIFAFSSIFIHLSTLFFLPLIFIKKYNFRLSSLIIILILALIISQFDSLDMFYRILSYLPQNSLFAKAFSVKLKSVSIDGSDSQYALGLLVYIEAFILILIGIIYYYRFPKAMKSLFIIQIIILVMLILFSQYTILALRYYLVFQFLKIFFYSFFFYDANDVMPSIFKYLGYFFLSYFLFKFFTCFEDAPYDYFGIKSTSDIVFFNLTKSLF